MSDRNEKPYAKSDFKTARDWHIYHVYNDPEFIEDFKLLNKFEPAKASAVLAKKYNITSYDVFFFDIRQTLYLAKNVEKKYIITPDFANKKFVFDVDLNISKAEYQEMWNEFSSVRNYLGGEPKTKRKPPENHELVYALFKSRMNHTWPEIYEIAVKGKLPGYKGVIPKYMDEDKLAEFYNKYKPTNT